MRLVIATALLFAATQGVAAGQPIQPQALASGEVLLEIDAVGKVRVPADRITLSVLYEGQGSSLGEARRAAEQTKLRLIEAAKAVGVLPEDIKPDPPTTRIGFVGNEAIDPSESGWTVYAPKNAPKSFGDQLEVLLRDVAQLEKVRRALEGAGATNVRGPNFVLVDDTRARRLAKADALRRAREEAEAYANASNMRVARVIRISERATSDTVRMSAIQDFMQLLGASPSGQDSAVEVRAVVGVDFALAPK